MKRFGTIALATVFALGALQQSADARLIIASTKIKNLTHVVSGGTTLFVAGEIKVDAIPSRCASGRLVELYGPGKDPKTDVRDDYDAAFFDKPYDFHIDVPTQNGTWTVYVPKFNDEKTKHCLGTKKTFTVP